MKTAEQIFIFVYTKDNQVKAINEEQSRNLHNILLDEGWNHAETLDACVYIEYKYREEYASQPMSAGPTVKQLREAAKNNPDTFLSGALYVIDNYKLNSPSMSAEQVFPSWEEAINGITDSRLEDMPNCYPVREGARIMYDRIYSMFSTAPTVKAEGWVSVEERQRLEQIIELKEKERQEWANMCITKQKRIEELIAGYGTIAPDEYAYIDYGKLVLKSISETFLKNATKADRLSDTEVFQALGETILNFPLPSPPTVNIN